MTWLYDNPETMNYDIIDEPIRELVKRINRSSWLRTEESCSGHPAGDTPIDRITSWAGHSIFLRLALIDVSKLDALFEWVEKIRAGYGGMIGWQTGMSYDRKDSLGYHWYLTLEYPNDVKVRHIAIDLVLRMFVEVDIWEELSPRDESPNK